MNREKIRGLVPGHQIAHVHPPCGPNGLHEPYWAEAWTWPPDPSVVLTSEYGLALKFENIESAREFVNSIQGMHKADWEGPFPDGNCEGNPEYAMQFLKGKI